MANTQTLTGFTELIYQARDIVAREPVGFATSVLVNSGSEGVSLNGTVKSFVANTFKRASPSGDGFSRIPTFPPHHHAGALSIPVRCL